MDEKGFQSGDVPPPDIRSQVGSKRRPTPTLEKRVKGRRSGSPSPSAVDLQEKNAGVNSNTRHKTPWSVKTSVKGRSSTNEKKRRQASKPLDTKSPQPIENDTDHIIRTMKLPTADEFPGLPVDFMERPKVVIHDSVKKPLLVNYAVTTVRAGYYRATARFHMPGKKIIEVSGKGSSKVGNRK